ncbi:hypothetical protein [Rhodopseudomonas palustris]|uniref:Uncharacterized protein n=1 Tax=Rhodopseudomonas palustris TaxID=1076 RepID=A0A418VH08_RHOPL|nr:hypothetical protein [Rhodopseudomonas palustris]RJF75405.1 hypothetical protein D4Q52_09480 [Rhodopseudomonas palustris]
MSQQLGIVLMIDSAAAIEAGSLEGNIYLVDNGKSAGSTGEGTPHLVTKINGVRITGQPDVQVLNWLPYGVSSPPPTLPQPFFLDAPSREALARHVQSAEPRLAARRLSAQRLAAGEEPAPVPEPEPEPVLPRLTRRIVDVLGRDLREAASPALRANIAARAAPEGTRVHYPNPLISNIYGEAVDLRVIYPAQYGSPDLFSDGLYWSASVDTSRVGYYSYLIDVVLFYSELSGGQWVERSITLPYAAYLDVTDHTAINGFSATPAILPA